MIRKVSEIFHKRKLQEVRKFCYTILIKYNFKLKYSNLLIYHTVSTGKSYSISIYQSTRRHIPEVSLAISQWEPQTALFQSTAKCISKLAFCIHKCKRHFDVWNSQCLLESVSPILPHVAASFPSDHVLPLSKSILNSNKWQINPVTRFLPNFNNFGNKVSFYLSVKSIHKSVMVTSVMNF